MARFPVEFWVALPDPIHFPFGVIALLPLPTTATACFIDCSLDIVNKSKFILEI